MKKTRTQEKTEKAEKTEAGPRPVGSLAELETLCREPISVRLKAGGKTIEVQAYRLTVRQEEERLTIIRKYTPPMITKGPDGRPLARPEYDERNPEYLANLEKQMRLARAVAVYRAVPIFQSGEEMSHEEIKQRLEERLTDGVLNAIYETLMVEDVTLAERTNFTTAPVSAGS